MERRVLAIKGRVHDSSGSTQRCSTGHQRRVEPRVHELQKHTSARTQEAPCGFVVGPGLACGGGLAAHAARRHEHCREPPNRRDGPARRHAQLAVGMVSNGWSATTGAPPAAPSALSPSAPFGPPATPPSAAASAAALDSTATSAAAGAAAVAPAAANRIVHNRLSRWPASPGWWREIPIWPPHTDRPVEGRQETGAHECCGAGRRTRHGGDEDRRRHGVPVGTFRLTMM